MSKIPSNRKSLPPPEVVFRQPRPSASYQPSTNSIVRDSLNYPFTIGDRVITSEKTGTVSFVGRTQFAEGEWIGITLDEAQGKNDGTVSGIRYFETDPNRGLFCRADKAQRISLNGTFRRISVYDPPRQSMIEANEVNDRPENPVAALRDPSSIKNLQIGDRVVIRGTKYGTLKYIGKIHINEGIWCGIKLEAPLGRHNGKIEGVRYFRCQHRFGIFAPLRHVEKLVINSKHSSIQFRESFSHDSNISELSSSSNSLNLTMPTRTTTSSTQKTSLSFDISSLLDKIAEKDVLIEKLQQQNDKDRLKLIQATQKIVELESLIIPIQQQYYSKDNENKTLIAQQQELTRRIEDLRIQVLEYEYPETDLDHVSIPNDHRLLSPNEIVVYEKTKEKVLELESMNRNLLYEKETFQEQLKRYHELKDKEDITNQFNDELKEEVDLLKTRLIDLQNKERNRTSQLEENEIFYKQQIKDYQSKIEQITRQGQNIQSQLTTLQQEKQTNEKRFTDLINELKRYKENIVPDMENQCQILRSELQNQEHLAATKLHQRETYYQQQLKEYQDHLNHATRETDQVRIELKHIQEENDLKQQNTNALIDQLRQNYNQIETELTELNNRENQANMTLTQRESLYEQQIKEYEDNLNRASREAERIQNEMSQLEEDKISHEKKSNHIINSVKQDYERQYETLKTQLEQLQEQDSTQNVVINERIAHYDIQIKEYQIKIDQATREIQSLRDELTKVHDENANYESQLNKTIETLENELNDREQKATITRQEYQQQLEDDKNNLEHINQQLVDLQTEFKNLQEEKISNEKQLNRTIDKLKEDYEILRTELQNQDHTQNITINEREAHYQSELEEYQTKSEQSLLELRDLQAELTKLQEEKTTNENQLNDTINTLKQDHEVQYKELQTEVDELNEREGKVHRELHQREAQFDQQIEDYQHKLEQANLKTEHFQTELIQFEEEKTKSDETINALQQDLAKLKDELHNRDQTQNMALNDREVHYQSQIKEHQTNKEQFLLQLQTLQSELTKLQDEKTKSENEFNGTIKTQTQDIEKLRKELNERERQEKTTLKDRELQYEQQLDEYQKNLELSIIQNQNMQTELSNLQEEKESNENNLNDVINSLKQDFEQEIQLLKTQNMELQKYRDNEEQEINTYQTKFDHLNEQITELHQQNETKLNQIHQLQRDLDVKHQTNTEIIDRNQQTQNESIERTENLTALNEQLKKEIEELKTRNEQLEKRTDDNETAEKQSVIDKLTFQINALQQKNMDLCEEQSNIEQRFDEEKKAQDKITKEKIGEYEMKVALMKSEYMVEMENIKLDHAQALLVLKNELQQATASKKKK